MEDNKLFSEFPPVSTEKWEEVINKDLKGADYEKKLVWKTIEGFKVKPYYRAEDLEGLEYLDSNPGQKPFTRGKHADNNVWEVRQDIHIQDLKEANRIALDAVERGATALGFCAKGIKSLDDMATLFKGIYINAVSINFMCSEDYLSLLKLYVEYAKQQGFNPADLQGSCALPPSIARCPVRLSRCRPSPASARGWRPASSRSSASASRAAPSPSRAMATSGPTAS